MNVAFEPEVIIIPVLEWTAEKCQWTLLITCTTEESIIADQFNGPGRAVSLVCVCVSVYLDNKFWTKWFFTWLFGMLVRFYTKSCLKVKVLQRSDFAVTGGMFIKWSVHSWMKVSSWMTFLCTSLDAWKCMCRPRNMTLRSQEACLTQKYE